MSVKNLTKNVSLNIYLDDSLLGFGNSRDFIYGDSNSKFDMDIRIVKFSSLIDSPVEDKGGVRVRFEFFALSTFIVGEKDKTTTVWGRITERLQQDHPIKCKSNQKMIIKKTFDNKSKNFILLAINY